jgi:hypothetical protein
MNITGTVEDVREDVKRCQVNAITEGTDRIPVLDRDSYIGGGVCVI